MSYSRLLLVILTFGLIVSCCGCGSRDTTIAEVAPGPADTETGAVSLPPDTGGLLAGLELSGGVAVRADSIAGETHVTGAETWYATGTGTSPLGTDAIRFTAEPGVATHWAMYRITGLRDSRPVSISVDAECSADPGGEYFIGFADYSDFTWEWRGPFTEAGQVTLNSMEYYDRVIDADNSLAVIVLMHSGELGEGATVDLREIVVNQLTPDDGLYHSTRPLFVPIDDGWVGDPVGEKQAEALSPAQYVTLTWTHHDDVWTSSAVLQYQVWRWDITGLPLEEPVHIGTVLPPRNYYVDPVDNLLPDVEPVPGHSYVYILKPWNSNGTASLSLLRILTIPEEYTYNLAASDGEFYDRIVLEWDTADDLTDYEIWLDDGTEPLAEVAAGDVVHPTEPERCMWEHPGLGAGETHVYRIRGLIGTTAANFSNQDEGSTAVPLELNLTAGDGEYYNRIVLDWDAADGATGYEIWLDAGSAPLETVDAGDAAHPTEPERCRWEHVGLAAGETHDYRVRPLLSAGAANYSNTDAGSTAGPVEFSFSAGDAEYEDRIVLEWLALAGAGDYEIWLDTDTTPLVTEAAGDVAHPTDPASCQWVHTGLAPDETHTYRVRALVDGEQTNYSDSDEGSTSPVQCWVHTWGYDADDIYYNSVINEYGEIYAVGGTASFGAGGTDQLVHQYSQDGTINWVRVFGNSQDSCFSRAVLDGAGNLIAAGTGKFNGDYNLGICLFKYARNGDLLWKKYVNWGPDYATYQITDMQTDAAGNLYIIGFSHEASASQSRLLKLDATGEVLWEEPWTPSLTSVELCTLYVTAGGDIYVAGHGYHGGNRSPVILKYNSDHELQWKGGMYMAGDYPVQGITVAADGYVYVTGLGNDGDFDVFVLKYSTSGAFVWARTWGGDYYDSALCAVAGPDGGVYMCGKTDSFDRGTGDGLLLKVDSDGVFSALAFDSGGLDSFKGLDITADGTIYLTGIALNAGGSFEVESGGVTSVFSPELQDPGTNGKATKTWSALDPAGLYAEPVGTVDAGGGGTDALLIRLAPGSL